MPSEWATALAPSTASGSSTPSPRRSAGRPRASASPRRRPPPARASSSAATALSTPPDIATSTRPGRRSASRSADAAAPASARCSASAESCAACRFAGVRPPIAASISSVPISRRVDHGLPLDHLGHRRGRRPGRAATLGVDGRRCDSPLLEDERHARQIAAGRAAGSAAVRPLGRRPDPGSRPAGSSRIARDPSRIKAVDPVPMSGRSGTVDPRLEPAREPPQGLIPTQLAWGPILSVSWDREEAPSQSFGSKPGRQRRAGASISLVSSGSISPCWTRGTRPRSSRPAAPAGRCRRGRSGRSASRR